MSVLRATTISDLAGTGPVTLTKQSAAKAWVSVNQTGTQAILASFNVSSIIDITVGISVINYSSAMASATYASLAGANPYNFGGVQGGVQSAGNAISGGSKTANRHTMDLRDYTNDFTDNDDVSSVVFGDLA